jgi:hypothetical protein
VTARRPTPRPTYDGPTLIRSGDAPRHLWGDEQSGFVSDVVYLSSDALHVLEFTLRPRSRFVHSPTNPTLFAADLAYVVLEGELILIDAEHGEVRPLRAGDTAYFGRDVWHHALNPGSHPARVVEYFAPPPSRGTSSAYGASRPLLESVRYADDRWQGRWPAARAEREQSTRLHVLSDDQLLWSVESPDGGHLLGTVADTEHLLVRRGRVAAGHLGDLRTAGDETLLLAESGELFVHVPEAEGAAWLRMAPGDAAYLPPGTTYRLVEQAGVGASYVLGAGRPVADGWTP